MKFSVCMSVYHKDDPQWFAEAVQSVLEQSVKPDEVVLVVDGPIPEPLNAAVTRFEEVKDFRIIRLPENTGHGNARRTGLENCAHELVAIMDADDISLPDRFEKQLAAFRDDPELSVVGGQIAEFVGDEKNIVGYRKVDLSDAQIRADLKKRCPLNQVTVMLKKADVTRAGGYLDWYSNEDYYLWIRMYLEGFKFANVPEVLVNVRVGEDMYQRRGGWKYFSSELRLQNYMLRHRVIGLPTWAVNAAKRLVVQLLLPNRLRSAVFQRFARKQTAME